MRARLQDMWMTHLDLQEVLGRPVDLVEALLARVGHRLQDGPMQQLRRRWRCVAGAGAPARVLVGRQFGGVLPETV